MGAGALPLRWPFVEALRDHWQNEALLPGHRPRRDRTPMNEPAAETDHAPVTASRPAPAGLGGSAALPVALAALLVALGAAGYSLLREPAPVTTLVERSPVQGGETAELAARIDELRTARRRVEDDIGRLGAQIERESRNLAGIPVRMDQLEVQVRRLAGGDRNRASWLLAEAEHYLRIANVQLGLASDVPVSRTALGLADDALREIGDPRLTPVRRLLSAEMAALDRVPRPDIEGIVLTLGSLADSLPTLALQRPTPDEFRPGRDGADDGLSATERAIAAIRDAFAGLVLVRRTSEPVAPLLGEADLSLLTRSLELELQLARLAIMRGDATMFRRSLESAVQRLERHFDPAARDVARIIETLNEIGKVELPERLPDISGSLALLAGITSDGGPATADGFGEDATGAVGDDDEAVAE